STTRCPWRACRPLWRTCRTSSGAMADVRRVPDGAAGNAHGAPASAPAWVATRGRALAGSFAVPGDKSVSHRAVMFAALADGTSRIDGFLEGEDTRATAAIFSAMGVGVEAPSPSRRVVHGVGIDGLRVP